MKRVQIIERRDQQVLNHTKNCGLCLYRNREINLQMMISKYIFKIQMKNPKKTAVERIASVQMKKTVSVIKCFICNQMFYSQKTFDDHMKVHSSKLSRNVPEQIQRKTMESFRVKKNTNTSSSRQMGVHGKKILNQTTSEMRHKMEEENEDQRQEDLSRLQIKQAQEALRQSTILIQKLEAMLHEQPQKQKEQQIIQQKQKESASSTLKVMSQQQFLQLVLKNQKISRKEAQQTKFTNQYLQSCQDQLIYLDKMASYVQKDQLNFSKCEKITGTILSAMIKYVKQNAVIQKQQQYIKQEQGLYLTHLPEKQSKSQKQIIQQEQSSVEIVENEELSFCNECYMMIEYGQECYRDITPQKKVNNQKPPRSYHTDCWQQRHQQPTPKN